MILSQIAAVPWRPTGAEGGGGSIVGSRAAAASELLQIEAAGAKSAPDSAGALGAWAPSGLSGRGSHLEQTAGQWQAQLITRGRNREQLRLKMSSKEAHC